MVDTSNAGPVPVGQKRPVLGILSCMAVLLTILLFVLAFILGFPARVFTFWQGPLEGISIGSLVFFLFIAIISASVISAIGLALGIIGINQRTEKKIYAYMGTEINGFLLIGLLVIFLATR